MTITLSTKGQIVLPAYLRRLLGLRPRAKLEIEEREGGLFIRPAVRAHAIVPIEYLPPGAITLSPHDLALDRSADEDDFPGP